MKKAYIYIFSFGFITASALFVLMSNSNEPLNDVQSPVKANPDRDTYYPMTEDLNPDEMRITSLGTGMPNQRLLRWAKHHPATSKWRFHRFRKC